MYVCDVCHNPDSATCNDVDANKTFTVVKVLSEESSVHRKKMNLMVCLLGGLMLVKMTS